MDDNNRSRVSRIAAITIVSMLLIIGSTAGIGAAFVPSGDPDPTAYVPEPTVEPGTTTTLSVQIVNDAQVNTGAPTRRDRVTMARNVVVELDAGGTPVTVETPEHSIGSVSENKPGSAQFKIDVPENAEPGRYKATVDIEFSYTSTMGDITEQESTETRTETITFEISDDPQFELTRGDTSQLRADENSLLDVNVKNTGGETARDVAVSLSSQSAELIFSGGKGAVARIDSLAPGETTQVTYEVAVGANAPARLYELNGAASYTNAQGIDGRDEDLSVGAEVAPRREDFSVDVDESVVTVGSSRLITAEVTNNRDQRLTDIEASLGTSDPLDSDDDSGYIAALDPGESETITFELSATGDANPKTYAAAVDFRYDDARGISRMSETYQLPVDVETDDGMELASISPLTIIIVLAAAAAAYGAAVYARAKPERLPWR